MLPSHTDKHEIRQKLEPVPLHILDEKVLAFHAYTLQDVDACQEKNTASLDILDVPT
jgi:hypothetical protein